MKIRKRSQLVKELLVKIHPSTSQDKLFRILDYIVSLPEEEFQNKAKFRQLLYVAIKRLKDSLKNDLGAHSRLDDFGWKLRKADCRQNFYEYVKIITPVVIPNEFQDGRHIKLICKELQSLFDSHKNPEALTEKIQVFLPPRSMKSLLCSVLFPSWVLGQNPSLRFILIGNSKDNAMDQFGRPLRDLMLSEEYKELFPETRIRGDVKSAQRFNTTAKGGFYVAGVTTNVAGRGGDFLICDDLLSEQSAYSKTKRNEINKKYLSGYRSRAQPGAAELIVNTRWHLDDISGFLQKLDAKSDSPWKIISIPAILDENGSKLLRRYDDTADVYLPGSSYWPEYKPLRMLESLRDQYLATEPHKWHALYMQNPVPVEGGTIKRTDWQMWKGDNPPKCRRVIVSMDTAYKETERSDFSAYTVWGIFEQTLETNSGKLTIPKMIMLGAEQGKWDFATLCQKCEDLRLEFHPDVYVIEKKQSGIVLLDELYRRSFPLHEVDPRGKKSERLEAASVFFKAKRIYAPEKEEFPLEVIEEVCNYPSVNNDDYVDTVSQAVMYMRDLGEIKHEAYDYTDDDEEDYEDRKVNSYWSSLLTPSSR